MRVVQIVGARPQFVKLAPVSREIARVRASGIAVDEFVIHTGQHYDPTVSDVFFEELRLPQPTVNLGVGSGAHGLQTGRMLERIEAELVRLRPDVTVVYGDTNSTLAGALAAVKLGIRTVHVEAGLRSHNRSMPEEINRVAVDHVSDLLLAPTVTAMEHLEREGLMGRARQVGDLMCDAVLQHSRSATDRPRLLDQFGLERGGFALATIHRAESTEPEVLRELLASLAAVGKAYLPVLLPLHPRTRAVIERHELALPDERHLRLVEPLGYLDMLRVVSEAAVVLTDSGGLQKEAFILATPCVTLRSETEWVETVEAGANVVVGTSRAEVIAGTAFMLGQQGRVDSWRRAALDLYGGGTAGERVVAEIVA